VTLVGFEAKIDTYTRTSSSATQPIHFFSCKLAWPPEKFAKLVQPWQTDKNESASYCLRWSGMQKYHRWRPFA
jgi:hypothetical protein